MVDYSRDCQIVEDEAEGSHSISFHCFDTVNTITVFHEGDMGDDVERLLNDAHQSCLEFHRLWSFTLEDSDIARINASPTRCVVDFRTAMLLSAMKAFHAIEPVFDFTIGSVSYLWKHAERMPSDDEVKEALTHVGAEKIVIEGSVVLKADPLVQVDVRGSAKGFIADAVAARLRLAGIKSARIDLGGNLYLLGSHPSGRLWRAAVRSPKGMQVEGPIMEPRDQSVVTSGSYERFVELDGVRYQHIVDAVTGRPSNSDIISATAVSASSLQADMLATTVLLTGTRGLPSLRSRHPEALIVAFDRSGAVVQ